MNTRIHFTTKHTLLAFFIGQIVFFILFFIISNNDNHINYTNSQILSMCRNNLKEHYKEIHKIASIFKRTSYEGQLTLTYTNGFSFGSITKDNQFSDILQSFRIMYPERNSFPFGRIRYTPEIIMFYTYLNQENYYAYFIVSYLSDNELLSEFPGSVIVYDINCNQHTNWFYKIDTNCFVYFSRERYMPIKCTYSTTDFQSILDNYYCVKDTLNYIKNVLLDAQITNPVLIQNFDSWYHPGCVDIFNENYGLLPRGLYKKSISHNLDSFFINGFYYQIKYFPDKQIIFSPANNNDYSFLFLVHPTETICTDYQDFVVLNNCDSILEIGNYKQLYQIDTNWYIKLDK